MDEQNSKNSNRVTTTTTTSVTIASKQQAGTNFEYLLVTNF